MVFDRIDNYCVYYCEYGADRLADRVFNWFAPYSELSVVPRWIVGIFGLFPCVSFCAAVMIVVNLWLKIRRVPHSIHPQVVHLSHTKLSAPVDWARDGF